MSFVAAAVMGGIAVATSIVQNVQAIDAKQDAESQAKKDKALALEAAQFAETEGEGIGNVGSINLSIDDTIDDDIRKQGQSNLSI
tara:strand:- start:1868 stop:2122 length:255 start_codon:yes stop_codon:yes gene_type:complete